MAKRDPNYKVLKADGTEESLTRDKPFALSEMQKIVGGYIELVRLLDGSLLVVDEEGILKQKPINVEASRLCQGFIVGDVIACPDWMVQ